MKQINEISWSADEGMTFSRKVDGFIMGNHIQLGKCPLTGEDDKIENYEEVNDPEYDQDTKSEKTI